MGRLNANHGMEMGMSDKKTKICIVSSCGGHLREVRALKSAYEKYDHFYVLDDQIILPEDMKDRTSFVYHSERDWLFFANLWEAFKIIRRERPSLILSTGAGVLVPFAIFAKLFRIPIVYMECITQVTKPSLTGRIMYWMADRFFYQWKGLKAYFPKGTYGGPVLWSS